MAYKSQYLKPRKKALKNIKNIVVLMLENRSFDNLLGWLYDDSEPPRYQKFEGLHKGLWNPLNSINDNGIAVTEKVYVSKNAAPIKGTKYIKADPDPAPDYTLPHPDPGEGYLDTNHQLFQHYDVPLDYPPEPTNMGFVDNYVNTIVNGTYKMFGGSINDPRSIMTSYTPEQTPVLSMLAREFAVCDHWHCSIPSQTLPNRAFVHAATSTGNVNNHPKANCDAPTIYNLIEDAINQGRGDLSWNIYSGSKDGKLFSLTRLLMDQLSDPSLDSHFFSIKKFYSDARRGKLPSYSFLEPQFSGSGQNDQHPPADIRPGEKLIADVYNAVVNSPQWNETLLVITYDEHGGCYDHVAPPGATPPDGWKNPQPGQFGFEFSRYGVRVPAVLVSPWIEKGTIARPSGYKPFDHTSILATAHNCFGLKKYLTERDKSAPDLSCVLTLSKPRKDKPAVNPLRLPKAESQDANDLHRMAANILGQLTGKAHAQGEDLETYLHEQYAEYFSKDRCN